MQRTNIYLTPQQKSNAERLKRENGISMAEQARRAIDQYHIRELLKLQPEDVPGGRKKSK